MKEQYKVIASTPLWVRKEPKIDGKVVGIVYPNTIQTIIAKQNGFLRNDKGWIAEFSTNGATRQMEKSTGAASILLARAMSVSEPMAQDIDTSNPNNNLEDRAMMGDNGYGILKGSSVYENITEQQVTNSQQKASSYEQALSNIDIDTLKGIYGMPYQWMSHVDPRLNKSSLGRVYSDRVIARMPMMIIAPGEPEFLAGYSASEKKDVLSSALGAIPDKLKESFGGESELDRLLQSEGKYYSFKYAGNTYYQYLNPMLRTAARLLNLGDIVYNGTRLDSYHWALNYNPAVYQYWTGRKSLAFYIESDTQISDAFTNDDQESALASKVNQFSDMARELQFLLGGGDAVVGLGTEKLIGSKALLENDMNVADSVGAMVSGSGAMSQFLKQITGGFQTVLAGGKLIFPNIWSSSSFSRSYSVSFKFVSPDYDDFSWYMNVLVPVCMLLCMTAPRQSGPQGYLSPFLVRAFYKGLFNCDMGLITSLNISKGTEGGWTRNGLPTVVNATIDIKDLYSNISITKTQNATRNILTNSILMDYLANLCGININEPDITRTIYLYYKNLVANRITDIPTDLFGGLDTVVMNKIATSFGRNFLNL